MPTVSEYKPWRGDVPDIDAGRIVNDMDQALHRWAWYIWQELTTIQSLPDADRAYHALTFAIVSPRLQFDKNAAATPMLVRAMRHHASVGEIESILRHYGVGLAAQKAERLYGARAMLENFTPDRALLLALRGVGPKVSSMAIALYDDTLPVFTIDTHMLTGITRQDVTSCSVARYMRLERFMLDAMHDPRRTVAPFATPFAVQWALWCDYSGKGFTSHLPIFGLEQE